ncbi:MAG: hypothetical protein AAGC70_11945 [Pseudomonadota bacterium]
MIAVSAAPASAQSMSFTSETDSLNCPGPGTVARCNVFTRENGQIEQAEPGPGNLSNTSVPDTMSFADGAKLKIESGSSLHVSSDSSARVDGTLDVRGKIDNLDGDVTISDPLIVTGKTTIQDELHVAEDSKFKKDLEVGDDLTVNDDLRVKGGINNGGPGPVVINDSTGLKVENDLGVHGDAGVKGDLKVGGDVHVDGKVEAKKVETKVVESKVVNAKYVNAYDIDAVKVNSVVSNSVVTNSKVVNAKYVNAYDVDAEYVSAKVVDAKKVYAKEVHAKKVEAKVVNAKYVNAKDVDTDYLTVYKRADFNYQRVTNVGTPIKDYDAANKKYVDSEVNKALKEIDENREGIAVAMAMSGLVLPAGRDYAVAVNWGHWDGKSALAGQTALKLNNTFTFIGAVGVGTDSGKAGGRLGFVASW